MNTTLLQTEWEACVLEPGRDPALEALAKRTYGMVPASLRYLMHCPWVARADLQLTPDNGLLAHLDTALADLVSMVVSQDNSCRFCFAVSHLLLRVQGLSDARIAELQAQLAQGAVEPRTAAAVAFARRMSRSQPLVGPADRQKLQEAGFSVEEIREMAYVIAFLSFANRLNTIPAIPPHTLERLPDRWMFKLMRPLMAWVVNAQRAKRRVQSAATVAGPRTGPFADLVQAYEGSPIATSLGEVLDGLWASPALTRRCKALLFGVVATGLGCGRTTDDIRTLLRGDGLADATTERALAHLQAAELDEVENLLLPFARDTLWYQPGPLQRRARELHRRLSPAQFVEAAGVLSLANALCRLRPAVVEVA